MKATGVEAARLYACFFVVLLVLTKNKVRNENKSDKISLTQQKLSIETVLEDLNLAQEHFSSKETLMKKNNVKKSCVLTKCTKERVIIIYFLFFN